MHNDAPEFKIEKVFKLFHDGMIERRLDKIIYKNGDDKDTQVLTFTYDDNGFPVRVEGIMLNVTVYRHTFTADNKIVYYLYDSYIQNKIHILDVVKKDNIYNIDSYFGLQEEDKVSYKIKTEALYDVSYIKYLESIYKGNKEVSEYHIKENKYGDIFIYSKDKNIRYTSTGLLDYNLNGYEYFIHANMIFTFTHFDNNGNPYKAKRIDGHRDEEYDVFVSSEKYYTDKYPMGEKLIESFRSSLDPSINFIVLRNIDNGKYFSKQTQYQINNELKTYYPRYQFNSWREVISETHSDDIKFLYEFKMVDEDITIDKIKELGGLDKDYNKSYHKINRYGDTLKKVKVLGDTMVVYEEDVEKDLIQK